MTFNFEEPVYLELACAAQTLGMTKAVALRKAISLLQIAVDAKTVGYPILVRMPDGDHEIGL
jgi:hypothetical protein